MLNFWQRTRLIIETKTRDIPPSARVYFKDSVADIPLGRWHYPMFLPAWAARTFIKITDVRPERLAEISEEDAIAEGCTIMAGTTVGGNMGLASARYSFAKLWDSINKAYPFDGNWWAWRICFNLIEDK